MDPAALPVKATHSVTRRLRLRFLLLLAVLLALWPLGDFAYVSTGSETDRAVPADVIIVLGCNIYAPDGGASPCMRARAGHAADLYNRRLAPWIIASGGPTEDGPTESAVLTQVLEDAGVPAAAIIGEDKSLNTIQNIHNSQAIMQQQGWRSAILVTEPFHINRATLIARDSGLTVYPSPAIDTPNWSVPTVRAYNLARDTLSLMLYQIKRLVGVDD